MTSKRRIIAESKGNTTFWVTTTDNDNMHWQAFMYGPSGSPYQDKKFEINIMFPKEYPSVAPIIKFITPIQHPCIDTKGNINIYELNDGWTAALNIFTVLSSIYSLLNKSELNVAY